MEAHRAVKSSPLQDGAEQLAESLPSEDDSKMAKCTDTLRVFGAFV